MIDKKWVDVLKLFDLTEYEAKTYMALVTRGPSTVKEIREYAGIPYSREYDILENLEKRGFVESQPGRPMKYRAVDPRKVLKRECDIRVKVVEELLREVGPIYEETEKAESMEDMIWTIRGRENVRRKLVDMIKRAKKEVYIVGIHPIGSKDIEDAMMDASKAGVKIKAMGMFDEECKGRLKKIGAEIKNYEHNHSRFVLVDDKELILASEDPANYFFALYNRNPGCINLYRNYFEHIWEEVSTS
jgi:sugar-specific transcriptional regulator TrmB